MEIGLTQSNAVASDLTHSYHDQPSALYRRLPGIVVQKDRTQAQFSYQICDFKACSQNTSRFNAQEHSAQKKENHCMLHLHGNSTLEGRCERLRFTADRGTQ